MLPIINWQTLSADAKRQQLTRPIDQSTNQKIVAGIIKKVREEADSALIQLTREFDKVALSSLKVAQGDIDNAAIKKTEENALRQALKTINSLHEAFLPSAQTLETAPGIMIERFYRSIQAVGLYVPGGNNTPLVSSLLMQALPAVIAGCPIRVLCTPPNPQGSIAPALLVAARLCQIDTIYLVGGAQAIAAMAYGTETIPKVDKIFGPGNAFVTEAKTQVSIDPEGAAIDMPAGPSEVMIVADSEANPDFVAADLLAQAEHGADSQVFLICDSVDWAEKVNKALEQQLSTLSRQAIIRQSLSKSAILLSDDREAVLQIINQYAPEHLILNCEGATSWVKNIYNAGTIFIGPWAAETMGDYVTGSNHVLPTNGFARNHSGLSVTDFLTSFTVQTITREGIESLGKAAYTLAMMEGLDAHANAVVQRLNNLGEGT